MTDLVETDAKAICALYGCQSPDDVGDVERAFYFDFKDRLKSAGFVIVPKEPTEAMLEAGHDRLAGDGDLGDLFRAMTRAAQETGDE